MLCFSSFYVRARMLHMCAHKDLDAKLQHFREMSKFLHKKMIFFYIFTQKERLSEENLS